MELYTLNDLLKRDNVFERFQSLIWTERFSAAGDFSMVTASTHDARSLFVKGTLLALDRSWRVMRVETVEDVTDKEGRALLKISGRELVKVLEDRLAIASLTSTTPWVVNDTPGDVARYMFDEVCRYGRPVPEDILPFLQSGTLFPPGTIAEPSDVISWSQPRDTLYNAIKGVCDLYDLGFRLVRNYDTTQLYFDVYAGSDRTSAQTALPAVIFSPGMDNLQNTTSLETIANTKNVAYVFSPAGHRVVYASGVDPEIEGFDRRVLMVESDVAAGTPNWAALLDQKGAEELSKHRSLQAFDGEFDQDSEYQYGIDYELGDLVEMRSSDGIINYMRVTEQIFVSDAEGERSYPTLSINAFVNPGSWAAMGTKEWVDFGSTEYWGTMP